MLAEHCAFEASLNAAERGDPQRLTHGTTITLLYIPGFESRSVSTNIIGVARMDILLYVVHAVWGG